MDTNPRENVEVPYMAAEDTAQDPQLQNMRTKLQENMKTIGIVAAIVVLAGAAWLYFRSQNEAATNEGALALSRVREYYDAGDYEKALKGDPARKVRGQNVRGLEWIAREYDGTETGNVAALYAGNALLAQRKADQAAKYFDDADDSGSPLVQAGAMAGLAATREGKNDFKGAAELYEKAAGLGAEIGFAARYKYFAALAHEKANNKEKAEELYREVVAQSEYSEFSGPAKSGLIRLGTVIE
jgi:predicted negative regulator of RcsB-dependent stress response